VQNGGDLAHHRSPCVASAIGCADTTASGSAWAIAYRHDLSGGQGLLDRGARLMLTPEPAATKATIAASDLMRAMKRGTWRAGLKKFELGRVAASTRARDRIIDDLAGDHPGARRRMPRMNNATSCPARSARA
jgi:hypothetical protein